MMWTKPIERRIVTGIWHVYIVCIDFSSALMNGEMLHIIWHEWLIEKQFWLLSSNKAVEDLIDRWVTMWSIGNTKYGSELEARNLPLVKVTAGNIWSIEYHHALYQKLCCLAGLWLWGHWAQKLKTGILGLNYHHHHILDRGQDLRLYIRNSGFWPD
jgi:hypothetical protein